MAVRVRPTLFLKRLLNPHPHHHFPHLQVLPNSPTTPMSICISRTFSLTSLRTSTVASTSTSTSSSSNSVPPNDSQAPTPTATTPRSNRLTESEVILGDTKTYARDDWTNVTERILNQVGRDLHRNQYHPLCLVKRRIEDFFYKSFPGKSMRSPLFSVFDNLHPVVTVEQNFDSLLVAKDHPSRKKSDCYYVDSGHLLRAHTSAHQAELIKHGMNNFLVVGDVYRRDEIDKTHYPIFHQVEGVRLCGLHEVFPDEKVAKELRLFESGSGLERTPGKQEKHSVDAVMVMTKQLQDTLVKLAQHLFGQDVETRWVDTFFPFTHPSWELEVKFNGEWMEALGCGIMEQAILEQAGAGEKIGWAFGLGLERLAMKLYEIPDIRLFWSRDPGFLHQFKVEDPHTPIIYKPVSIYPPCTNDMSFWLPQDSNTFSSNDFYDLVRSIGGEYIEQVSLFDEFHNKKKGLWSHSYRIVYRHPMQTLTQRQVNYIHKQIADAATKRLKVVIR